MRRFALIASSLGVIILLVALSITPRDVAKDSLRFALLSEQSNHALPWVARIYGIPNDEQSDDPFIGAEHIRIVHRSGAKYCIFRPSNQSGYSYTPKSVWSPTGRYLVLSDGPEEGFVIYQTSKLPAVVPGMPHFRAKVVWTGGFRPVHQFDGWTEDGGLLFSARADGISKHYRCDLDEREIVLLSAETFER